ncbi:forkhead box protein N1 isoform X2 [Xenopus laevis]|uniref:Forkhead box protein N1 isoform X2 n=1 Tax=Xenopus laevis TaxID=8355 RepID=A0A8J0UJ57_XENLA|nr:forkhead box protein N1 isoform X2 [Xenopus laevis]
MESEKEEFSPLDNEMVNSQSGFVHNQELFTSSIMQDQSNLTFSSGSLDNECSPINQPEDAMLEKPGPASSCLHMDTYGSHTIDINIQGERKNSDSSMSPTLSPPQEHIQMGFPSKSSPRELFRRYSCDDTTERSYSNFIKDRNQFNPYKRQFSDVFPNTLDSLSLSEKTFKEINRIDTFEDMCAPPGPEYIEPFAPHMPDISTEQAWCNSVQYNSTPDEDSQLMLGSVVKIKSSAMGQQEKEQRMYWTQTQQLYCSPQSFPQYSTGGSFPVSYISTAQYPYQRIAPQASMETQQPLYPKPIYSYSILIFMALKNSKTGSLPVSEIYNFMTENFPYFKTAPDGWKNSVRHNLSLNKCFEKVENKSGSSSRKGCLWALNPAKIEKMQEELQKWKRKDPVTVRKSMAKPDLDKLIGERTEKLRSSLLAHNGAGLVNSTTMQLSMQTSLCETTISPMPVPLQSVRDISASLQDNSHLVRQQPPCYTPLPHDIPLISPAMIQQPRGISHNHFSSPDNQSDLRAQPINPQDSPIPAHTPPHQTMNLLTQHSPTRTMQENLAEVELSNDIDDLNPSLTDFDFQGSLWEELRDDSLVLDPLNLVSPSPTPPPPQYFVHNSASKGFSNGTGSPNNNLNMSYGDIHLTTVYSSFVELDKQMPSYLSTCGSKHLAIV